MTLTNAFVAGLIVAALSCPALVSARFQNENDPAFKAILAEIHDSVCVGSTFNAGECPTASGAAISTILANAGPCDQQDAADGFIDLANKGVTDPTKRARFIRLAQQFRVHERNSVPNPCSAICERPPRNAQLLGLRQDQDPACKSPPAFPPQQAAAASANAAQVQSNLAAVGRAAVQTGGTASPSSPPPPPAGNGGKNAKTDTGGDKPKKDAKPATTAGNPSKPASDGAGAGSGAGIGATPFRCQNGRDAQAGQQRASSLKAKASCAGQDGLVVCLADGSVGQCANGVFVSTPCAATLSCQVLPLRNRAGTSVACTTAADASARIAEA
ncbi:hypothetical protein BC831DRAFT_473011, partial [Entophlyctis helioformis]